jgi:hypothetical protein
MIVLWLAVAVVLTCLVLTLAFFTCMTIQNAREQNVWMPWWVKAIGRALYYPGALADIAFNQTIAPFLARELHPHGWTFSNRVQWHIDNPADSWHDGAVGYARFLNFVRRDHIKRVPP